MMRFLKNHIKDADELSTPTNLATEAGVGSTTKSEEESNNENDKEESASDKEDSDED